MVCLCVPVASSPVYLTLIVACEMSANSSRLYVDRLAEVSALTLVLITMQEKVKIPGVMIRRCYHDNFV